MKSYDEMKMDFYNDRIERDQKFRDIENVYRHAEKIVEYIYQQKVGTAWVSYSFGMNYISVYFTPNNGSHPVKEALILVDEMIYSTDWLVEREFPEKLENEIHWKFSDRTFPKMSLYINVEVREEGGCRRVGTGKFEEIMEWRCQ